MENDARSGERHPQVYPDSLPAGLLERFPDADELLALCRKWGVEHLAAYGCLKCDDEQHPLRMVIRFRTRAPISTTTFSRLQDQLSVAFHRPVQLIEQAEIMFSDNPILLQRVTASSRTLFREL